MNDDLCKGCGISKVVACAFIRHSLEHNCPCVECLVKVTCRALCDHREEVRVDVFMHRSKYPMKGERIDNM